MNTVLGAVNDILGMSLRPVSVAHDQRPAVAASSMLAAVAAPPARCIQQDRSDREQFVRFPRAGRTPHRTHQWTVDGPLDGYIQAPPEIGSMDSSTLLCLFSGRVEERDGEYIITIPQQEVDLRALESEETYRVGVYPGVFTPAGVTDRRNSTIADDDSRDTRLARQRETPNPARDSSPSTSSKTASQSASTDSTPDQPP